jgi:putative addiction module component (TIGR02574 family)
MPNKLPLPPSGFDDLPVSDQIDYVQSLWDRIAAKPEKVPVPDWHLQVLEERLAEGIKGGESRNWQEFRDELRSKLSRGPSKPE